VASSGSELRRGQRQRHIKQRLISFRRDGDLHGDATVASSATGTWRYGSVARRSGVADSVAGNNRNGYGQPDAAGRSMVINSDGVTSVTPGGRQLLGVASNKVRVM